MSEKQYELDEVAKHTSTESCWLIIGNSSNGTYYSATARALLNFLDFSVVVWKDLHFLPRGLAPLSVFRSIGPVCSVSFSSKTSSPSSFHPSIPMICNGILLRWTNKEGRKTQPPLSPTVSPIYEKSLTKFRVLSFRWPESLRRD